MIDIRSILEVHLKTLARLAIHRTVISLPYTPTKEEMENITKGVDQLSSEYAEMLLKIITHESKSPTPTRVTSQNINNDSELLK